MALEELAWLDATAQANLVRTGELQPLELVQAAIERIERLNPVLNAVVTPMFESARELARGPFSAAPFAGVPFLLKDLVAEYAGVRFTEGSAFLKNFVPERDSELVRRLKRSGLIVVGKTNTPEFGSLPTTEPLLFGPARNPWDTTRTPGGSSGGAAAAVASGMVPMAHGNDGGGSIRMPASCCGVFGLKPTRGRNPLGPHFGDMISGIIAEHALTRSVRDSAALLDATSGQAPGDPYRVAPPARPFAREVEIDPGILRIAFTTRAPSGVPVNEDCVRAAENAAGLCRELGHTVEQRDLVIESPVFNRSFFTLWCGGAAWTALHWERRTGCSVSPDTVEPLTWALLERGRRIDAGTYLLALEDLQRIARDIAEQFARWDLWLTPTLGEPPVPLGTFDPTHDNPMHGFFRAATFMPFTSFCNVTGQPAMSVPLFWNDAGLPIGTQFVGHFGDEAVLFRLAAQLETARPWAAMRPPVRA